MENRTGNKTVVTSPTVEFLLKQVYAAYKEKVKGLEFEVQNLKSELQKQKDSYEECKQCKILKDELKKCKENYLKILSDQKCRIEHLEMQLSTWQAPVPKNKMPFHSKTVDEPPYEKCLDEPSTKKQSGGPEFLHPEKKRCSFFVKTGNNNNHLSTIRPLPGVIVPETLDINDDADITILGVYDKESKGTKDSKITTGHIVPESVDIDLVEVVEHRKDDITSVNNRIILGAMLKNCNEADDIEEKINTDSPSLLPQAALPLGKMKLNVVRAEDNKENSKTDLLLEHPGEKNLDSSSCGDVDVARDFTSPSLISPPEKKQRLCLNVTLCNKQEANNSSSSLLSTSGNRNLLLNDDNSLEDMDETCFPLPPMQYKTLQSEKMEEGFIDDVPDDISIVEVHMPDEKCHSTVTQDSKNHATTIVKPAVECSFDMLPTKVTVNYKFKEETVRKKEDRARLLGHPCKLCEEYYNQLDMPESEKAKRITNCSRHRAVYKPPATPEHFWELDFPDTPECRARGYVNETQKVQFQSRRNRPLALRKDK